MTERKNNALLMGGEPLFGVEYVGMNWYRRAKIAVVVDEQPAWEMIGHCNYYNQQNQKFCPGGVPDVEELWMIDYNQKMYTQPTAPEVTHGDAFPNFPDYMAYGRYVKDKSRPEGECTMFLDLRMKDWNPRRVEYQKNRIVRILESRYGAGCKIFYS